MTGRDRGVLTDADREYLRGEKELSEGSEFNTKRRIRERINDALLDFTILFEHLDQDERKKIFVGGPRVSDNSDKLPDEGMRDTLAFVLEAAGGISFFKVGYPMDNNARQILERAIRRIGARYGHFVRSVDVEVTTDSEELPWDIYNELEEGGDLPPEALWYLMDQREDVDTKRVQEVIREMVFSGENSTE